MISKIFTKNKPLFCEEYWARQSIKNLFKPKRLEHVSHYFDLHDVNYLLLGYMNSNFNANSKLYADSPPITVKDAISLSDREFKLLKPIRKNLTLWRGIEGNYVFPERFQKAYKAKAGDIIYMPEYAYASELKMHAERFANGLLYEITVPRGAKLSKKSNYIFPRYSKFECIGVEDKEDYRLIKLKYLPKKEPLLKHFAKKIITCFNKN
jgi:hypothetical protein